VIGVARRHGIPVRGVWLTTSLEDAQVNAATRMLVKYGRLLEPEEMRVASRTEVSVFPPTVQFRYQRELEPPNESEGFSRLDMVPFARSAPSSAGSEDPEATPPPSARAVILWCDGVLQRSRGGHRTPLTPDDVEAIPGRGAHLRRYADEGWKLFGLSWLPEIADGGMSHAQATAVFARLRDRLGVEIDIRYCPHAAGPPACWCRKPLPGLGVVLRERYRLDAAQCIYVGVGNQDPGFARRLGFELCHASEFFGAEPKSSVTATSGSDRGQTGV
jgi:histidinol phosphatase-like enzyme